MREKDNYEDLSNRFTIKRRIVAAVILICFVAVFAFQGCVSSGPSSSSGTGNSVEMKNIAFNPGTLTVSNGTTVTWYNNDTTTHTALPTMDRSRAAGILSQDRRTA